MLILVSGKSYVTCAKVRATKDRNSDLSEWLAFAEGIDPDIYCPIFVRDTERCFERQPRVRQSRPAITSMFHLGWPL